MNWLRKLLRKSAPPGLRTTTVSDPFIIRGPRLAFVNLLGPAGRSLVAEDRRALEPVFGDATQSEHVIPCDVLMLYCTIDSSGRLQGERRRLREIIRDSQAPIVVVASENPPEGYIAAGPATPDSHANLVMTISRNGQSFQRFFRGLFERMFSGKTMPMAWVELAPQIPGQDHVDAPETIFACEAGHLLFQKE